MEYLYVDNLGEYAGYLPKSQIYSIKEVADFYNAHRKLSTKEKNEKLAELLQQPIMGNAYRAAGMVPEQISDYVNSILEMSDEMKNGMIADLYVMYDAVKIGDDKQISYQNEWAALARSLAMNLSAPMKRFVVKHSQKTDKSVYKFELGRKMLRWVGKCATKIYITKVFQH